MHMYYREYMHMYTSAEVDVDAAVRCLGRVPPGSGIAEVRHAIVAGQAVDLAPLHAVAPPYRTGAAESWDVIAVLKPGVRNQ